MPKRVRNHPGKVALAGLVLLAALLATLLSLRVTSSSAAGADPCSPPVTNAIACENSKPGTPLDDWDVIGIGDPSIQGYATAMSVNLGQTERFKIKTSARSYHIDILRLGYYGGDGARQVATIQPSASLPQSQPACLNDSSTGLIDCGNWGVSASWTVPSDAVSGVYIAHLVRDDTGGGSQIPFVVRDDSSHSDVLLQTSDETWQAYNAYGGNSLYSCTVSCPPGNPKGYKAAYAVSYNRPFDGSFATDGGLSYLWYAEFQMIAWLEENGYNVSYTSEGDVEGNGALLKNHKVFISSGHDEYWSAGQRNAVTAARDAGVNLAFFSGNEIFWKTRWGTSIDGSSTPRRTVITYKETHFDSPVDPQDPPTWTGSWVDPRFSPPADGGNPPNSLTGQFFVVNSGSSDITVPSAYSRLRFWRNTAASRLTSGQTLTLSPDGNTLGYEWDEDLDNGFRPPGLFDLSSTTVKNVEAFTDYGSTTQYGSTGTHHLTLYKAPSGALVFGAGTVQWSWGLMYFNAWHDGATEPSQNPPDPNMQQATVNLLADMGSQPSTLQSGLVQTTQSTDSTPPMSTITSPSAGASVQDGQQITVSGTATDTGGQVAGVEVSTDGGTTWHPANGTSSWTYTWNAHGNPSTTIKTRAVDDSGNIETPSAGLSVNVGCPCTLFGNATPPTVDGGDGSGVELGVKFNSEKFGTVSGIRFYKSAANTGTHIGSLWDSNGNRLAQATFTSETASGWQKVTFASPVTINPNTTYIASYYAPNGHYSETDSGFYTPTPVGRSDLNAPPLHILGATTPGGNGLFQYTGATTFPTQTYQGANYWVDVMFTPSAPPGAVSNVNAAAGTGAASVSWTAPTTGGPVSKYTITPYIGSTAQTPTVITGTPPATGANVSGLTPGTSYTFTVQASNGSGDGPVSAHSNAVTPAAPTVPSAPTGVTATASTGSALVNWTAPIDGGSPITGYTVTPFIGSTAQAPVNVGGSVTSQNITSLTNGVTYTFKVTATNAIGSSPASAASNAVIPAVTILNLGTPAVVDSSDPNSVELGVKFRSDTFGVVTGVRFYKAATNTGTHIGSLWDADGNRLAQATFTNETASGWQQVMFANPVPIQANTTYVASYLAPNGHYSDNSPGFTTAIDNAPLHALADGTSPNGVYRYSSTSTFPLNSWNATNYWVDVTFGPAPAPGQVTGVTATASGGGTAKLSWNAPSSGGAPTKYTITPYIGTTAQPSTTITDSPLPTTATVQGLAVGGAQTYTFTVTASNPNGSGPESAKSNAVTVAQAVAPDAPTGVSASPRLNSMLVSWTPGSTGGSPITKYTITPFVGSTALSPVTTDGSSPSATVSGLASGTNYTFTVTATNAVGTSPASAPSSAGTPLGSIFGATSPSIVDSGDDVSVELGMKFESDIAGSITGIRFYKALANTGSHIGNLWTTDGTRLATGTFSNETSSGWQQLNFTTPVPIQAGTIYVASYFAPRGHYSYTASAFATAIDTPPLHAVADRISSDGVYAYGGASQFPTSTWNATNYWVDVVFSPGS